MAAVLTLYQKPPKNTRLPANSIHYHYIVNIHHYVDNCDFFLCYRIVSDLVRSLYSELQAMTIRHRLKMGSPHCRVLPLTHWISLSAEHTTALTLPGECVSDDNMVLVTIEVGFNYSSQSGVTEMRKFELFNCVGIRFL